MNYAETQWHPFPTGRKRRGVAVDELTGQKFERYDVEAIQVGNEKLKDSSESNYYEENYDEDNLDDDEENYPNAKSFSKATYEELADTSGSRWLMYDGLGKLLYSKGLQGRPCVLRGICEAAETKFTHHSGLFGELFHIAFT